MPYRFSVVEADVQADVACLSDDPLPDVCLQGFYVTIDFHFEQAGLQNNPARFAAEWRRLWTDFISLPTYKGYLDGRVIPELANEWDNFGCRWDTTTGGESMCRHTRA